MRGSNPVSLRLFVLALGFATFGCRAVTDDIHSWGSFNTTRTRLGDTCRAVDGGCFTAASTTLVTLGVHSGDPSSAVLKRASNVDVTGTQSGARFLFVIDTADGGVTQTVCGCQATLRETIWGEFHTSASESFATDAGAPVCDGGNDGTLCSWWLDQPPCGTDPGLSPGDWIADAGSPSDLNAQYSAFVGTVVDELTQAPNSDTPDGGCSCLPCRVTYQLSGSL